MPWAIGRGPSGSTPKECAEPKPEVRGQSALLTPVKAVWPRTVP